MRTILLLLVFSVCNSTNLLGSTTWIVDDDGQDHPSPHFATIQEAVDIASSGDEILVYPGTYTGEGTNSVISIIDKGLHIRSAVRYEAVIDGEGERRCVYVNSYAKGGSCTFSEFRFENGFASSQEGGHGGGLILFGREHVLETCMVLNSVAENGGGVYIISAPLLPPTVIDNCVINGCHATTNGGGLYVYQANVSITNTTAIAVNTADNKGGGIYATHSSLLMNDTKILTNSARQGGGAYFTSQISDLVTSISDCTVFYNSASHLGGGFAFYSGGDYEILDTDFQYNNAIASNGGQGGGGAIFNDSTNPIIEDCSFQHNTATSNGGGIYNWSSAPTIDNCDFKSNSANSGGGIRTYNGSGPFVEFSTFCDNSSNIAGPYVDGDDNCLANSCNDWNQDGIYDECVIQQFNVYQGMSIQDAINQASSGDEIIIHDGEWTRNNGDPFAFVDGKELWIHSAYGSSSTTLNGNFTFGPLIVVVDSPGTRIEGLHLKNSYSASTAAGIESLSDILVTDCLIEDCISTAGEKPGGIFLAGGSLHNTIVRDCRGYVGGVFIEHGSMFNVEISNNSGDRAGGCVMVTGSINYSTISDNEADDFGAGLLVNSVNMAGCTVQNNHANGIGGFVIGNPTENPPSFTNNTIIGNTNTQGVDIDLGVDNLLVLGRSNTIGHLDVLDGANRLVIEGYGNTIQESLIISGGTDLQIDVGRSPYWDQSKLIVEDSLVQQSGTLIISDEDQSLDGIVEGESVLLASGNTVDLNYDAVMVPFMPEGLGMQFQQTVGINGNSSLNAEIVEVATVDFDNPFSDDLSSVPVDLVTFDVEGDGSDELAILFEGSPGGVAVYNITLGGSPVFIDGFSATVSSTPTDIDAGDLNGDGYQDLVIAHGQSSLLVILETIQNNDGSFSFSSYSFGSNQPFDDLAIIDWDGDTYLDLVTSFGTVSPRGFAVALDIAGQISNGPWFPIPDGDLQNDFDIPLSLDGGQQNDSWGFVGGTSQGRIYYTNSSSSSLLLVDDLGNSVTTIEATELDGSIDNIDLMVSSQNAESIYLYEGESTNDVFSDRISLITQEQIYDLVTIDADFDGDQDLLFTAPESLTPLVLLRNDGGSGSGGVMPSSIRNTTWAKQEVSSDNPPRMIDPADVNNDKDLDGCVVGAGNSNSALRGSSENYLEQTNLSLTNACIADINDDEKVDVDDLLTLLGSWGRCVNCGADFNQDTYVDVIDLLYLIDSWGICSQR